MLSFLWRARKCKKVNGQPTRSECTRRIPLQDNPLTTKHTLPGYENSGAGARCVNKWGHAHCHWETDKVLDIPCPLVFLMCGSELLLLIPPISLAPALDVDSIVSNSQVQTKCNPWLFASPTWLACQSLAIVHRKSPLTPAHHMMVHPLLVRTSQVATTHQQRCHHLCLEV